MTHSETLLREALRVLDRYAATLPAPDLHSARRALEDFIFDDDGVCRDDVINICQKIDELPPTGGA